MANNSFQLGMPLQIKEVVEKAKSFNYSELLKHAEENTNVCRISDSNGMLICLVPILGKSLPFMDLNLVKAKGWSIDIYAQCGEKLTTLTDSYWACKCKTDYVHHKIKVSCKVCSCLSTHTGRLGYVEDILDSILKWQFIVGEEMSPNIWGGD